MWQVQQTLCFTITCAFSNYRKKIAIQATKRRRNFLAKKNTHTQQKNTIFTWLSFLSLSLSCLQIYIPPYEDVVSINRVWETDLSVLYTILCNCLGLLTVKKCQWHFIEIHTSRYICTLYLYTTTTATTNVADTCAHPFLNSTMIRSLRFSYTVDANIYIYIYALYDTYVRVVIAYIIPCICCSCVGVYLFTIRQKMKFMALHIDKMFQNVI